ncbi:MAG TPA: hypothetical protein VFO19_09255 [Vicinamibacterales bacterium]|nr:hypothetical protein [Vicinamibacterales bacterium]
MRVMPTVAVLVLVLALPAAVRGQTPDERAAARTIVAKHGPALVTVLATVKIRMTMAGREAPPNEENIQSNATLIAADGLAVMPLSALEPGAMMSSLFARMDSGAGGVDVKSELTNLRMRMADGKEVPARVALRDTDLDLAFLHPVEPLAAPAAFVDAPSARVQPMDLLVVISRLGEMAGWQASGTFVPVMAVLDKPRTAYFAAANGVGGAAFDTTGKFVGITVFFSKGKSGSGGGSMSMLTGGMNALDSLGLMPVVVPADDIREVAKQAQKGGH